jgi:hypothetical protein
MKMTPTKANLFMLFKLPLAYFAGVRVVAFDKKSAIVKITHQWINQNPFKSMFWAAQGMAAEMSTAVLVMNMIKSSSKQFSMLVTNQRASFTKKATGEIRFECRDGDLIMRAIQESTKTGEGQVITMRSEGFNLDDVSVCEFHFEWSLKIKA